MALTTSLYTLAFYFFSGLLLASGFMVVASPNTVYSVIYLIFSFINAAALFILMGAPFVGLIMLIVYVGAVAILFLFVVMMLDLENELRSGLREYKVLSFLFGVIFVFELIMVFVLWQHASSLEHYQIGGHSGNVPTRLLGHALYSTYVYSLDSSALVLFVAMIGAVILTARAPRSKHQNISHQVSASPSSFHLIHVTPGSNGLKEGREVLEK